MSHRGARPLRRVLQMTQEMWDREDTRPAVREAFQRALDCGTPALGAEVFASENDERVVYHTCKSRACPSCGQRATVAWQRDLWRELPDAPYAHICLTMPDVLWPLFRRNRDLLHDLPVLGAEVLQILARRRHGVRLMIVVIPHSFGRALNFNCHLHILVSQGGLTEDATEWRSCAQFDREAVMRMWRYAVIEYLREAARVGILDTDLPTTKPMIAFTVPSPGSISVDCSVPQFGAGTYMGRKHLKLRRQRWQCMTNTIGRPSGRAER